MTCVVVVRIVVTSIQQCLNEHNKKCSWSSLVSWQLISDEKMRFHFSRRRLRFNVAWVCLLSSIFNGNYPAVLITWLTSRDFLISCFISLMFFFAKLVSDKSFVLFPILNHSLIDWLVGVCCVILLFPNSFKLSVTRAPNRIKVVDSKQLINILTKSNICTVQEKLV